MYNGYPGQGDVIKEPLKEGNFILICQDKNNALTLDCVTYCQRFSFVLNISIRKNKEGTLLYVPISITAAYGKIGQWPKVVAAMKWRPIVPTDKA